MISNAALFCSHLKQYCLTDGIVFNDFLDYGNGEDSDPAIPV
jgi:hypothetical protein